MRGGSNVWTNERKYVFGLSGPQVAPANQAAHAANRVLEQHKLHECGVAYMAAKRDHDAATQAVQNAERALERERQRSANAKPAAATAADRRVMTLADSRRYPQEDLDVLADAKERAKAAGEAPPANDVARPAKVFKGAENAMIAEAMYVADFVSEFAPHLGLMPVSMQGLTKMLEECKLVADQEGQVRRLKGFRVWARVWAWIG